MVVSAIITGASLVATVVFIVKDPFTHDWRDLQSSTGAIRAVQGIEKRVREKLDTSALLSGQAFQLAIAVDRRDQVKPLVDKLRADDAKRPEADRWIKDVRSIDDLIPQQQHEKAELLRGIDKLLGDPKLQASLSDQERADLERVRPKPADLEPVTDADVRTLVDFYRAGRGDRGFEAGIELALERLLISPEFLIRIEQDPDAATPGAPYRIRFAARLFTASRNASGAESFFFALQSRQASTRLSRRS